MSKAPIRSDIRLGSAERLAASRQNSEQLERARAAAWHQQNVAMIDLNQPLEDWFRQSVVNFCTKRFGSRKPNGGQGHA